MKYSDVIQLINQVMGKNNWKTSNSITIKHRWLFIAFSLKGGNEQQTLTACMAGPT